jgi:hypothetical protein
LILRRALRRGTCVAFELSGELDDCPTLSALDEPSERCRKSDVNNAWTRCSARQRYGAESQSENARRAYGEPALGWRETRSRASSVDCGKAASGEDKTRRHVQTVRFIGFGLLLGVCRKPDGCHSASSLRQRLQHTVAVCDHFGGFRSRDGQVAGECDLTQNGSGEGHVAAGAARKHRIAVRQRVAGAQYS